MRSRIGALFHARWLFAEPSKITCRLLSNCLFTISTISYASPLNLAVITCVGKPGKRIHTHNGCCSFSKIIRLACLSRELDVLINITLESKPWSLQAIWRGPVSSSNQISLERFGTTLIWLLLRCVSKSAQSSGLDFVCHSSSHPSSSTSSQLGNAMMRFRWTSGNLLNSEHGSNMWPLGDNSRSKTVLPGGSVT